MATATFVSKLLTLGVTGALGAAGLVFGPAIGPTLQDGVAFGSEPTMVSVDSAVAGLDEDDEPAGLPAQAAKAEGARVADRATRRVEPRLTGLANAEARTSARTVARTAERPAERPAEQVAERATRQAEQVQARDTRRTILRDERPAPSDEGSRGLRPEDRQALQAARPGRAAGPSRGLDTASHARARAQR